MADHPYTIQDFKDKFPNDFVYLSDITWDATTTYFAGNQVYYAGDSLFYKAMATFSGIEPSTDPSSWQLYEDSIENYVSDNDIDRAMAEADCVWNPDLAATENEARQQYLYLTAHYLCLDKRITSGGLMGQLKGQVTSVSVGSVSESYQVPDAWTSNIMLFPFTTTAYGLIYLGFVAPKIVGNVRAVAGATIP